MTQFSDILDEQQLKDHLQNSLKTGNISHAYILAGEKGSGKKMIAKLYAKTLQCEDPQNIGGVIEPCGKCHSCIQAENEDHPDIITVHHEHVALGVDDIREQVRDSVSIKPYSRPRKVYIIPDGEKMTIQAQNALLKTLEEPPAYVVILILTDNIDVFLPTILSRCITLQIRPVSDESLLDYLIKKKKVANYAAELCVAFARGNVGRAMQLAESESFENVRLATLSLMETLPGKDITSMNLAVKEIIGDKKEDHRQDFMDVLMFLVRDLTVYKAAQTEENLIFRDKVSYIRSTAQSCSFQVLGDMMQAILRAQRRLDTNVNAELTMEMLMLDLRDSLQTAVR